MDNTFNGFSDDHFGDYLKQIGRYPLLTPEQEITFSRQIRQWLENPNDQKLARIGKRAQDKMITSNMRLVVSISKKFYNRSDKLNIDRIELIQEGALGLRTATEKFDPSKGYKFSTYSYWWIRQAIGRFLDISGRTIRLPIHIQEDYKKIVRTLKELMVSGDRVTPQAIADQLNSQGAKLNNGRSWKAEKVQYILDCSQAILSLDFPTNEGDHTLGDTIFSLDDAEAKVDESILAESVNKVIDQCLDDRHADVIRARFGIGYPEPLSLAAVGQIHNISRERVRQIEKAARLKLKRRRSQLDPRLLSG